MKRPNPEPLLRPRQSRYLASLRPPRDTVRREIERRAASEGWRLVTPEVARLLEGLAARDGAPRIVEVGCGVGYATLHLARGAAEGRIVAVDDDAAALAIARKHLELAGVAARVELRAGAPPAALDGLTAPLDLVVVDAARWEPRRLLDLLVPLVRVGGTLVFLGVLADGRVGDPALRDADDRLALQLERFNPYLSIHPQLTAVLLPLGAGVALAVKRRPTRRELGGPF